MKYLIIILSCLGFAADFELSIGDTAIYEIQYLEPGEYRCEIQVKNFAVFYPLEFANGTQVFETSNSFAGSYFAEFNASNFIEFRGIGLAGNFDSTDVYLKFASQGEIIYDTMSVKLTNLYPRELYQRFPKLENTYPNVLRPFEEFTIEYINDHETSFQAFIYDNAGKLFDSFDFGIRQPGRTELKLNTNRLLTNGIYHVLIVEDRNQVLTKVLISN